MSASETDALAELIYNWLRANAGMGIVIGSPESRNTGIDGSFDLVALAEAIASSPTYRRPPRLQSIP